MTISFEGRTRFATVLKGLREQAAVSQSKLAERAGFDHSYVSRLESGSRTPTREAVEQLAKALGADASSEDELLAAAGFLPRELSSLLTEEPEVSAVLGLLQDDRLPSELRQMIREQLRLLSAQIQMIAPERPRVSPRYPHVAA